MMKNVGAKNYQTYHLWPFNVPSVISKNGYVSCYAHNMAVLEKNKNILVRERILWFTDYDCLLRSNRLSHIMVWNLSFKTDCNNPAHEMTDSDSQGNLFDLCAVWHEVEIIDPFLVTCHNGWSGFQPACWESSAIWDEGQFLGDGWDRTLWAVYRDPLWPCRGTRCQRPGQHGRPRRAGDLEPGLHPV